jgi:hypothetical protein
MLFASPSTRPTAGPSGTDDASARHARQYAMVVNVPSSRTSQDDGRSQLQALLKYCRTHKGKVHFVVVYNLTRFAREKYDHFALRAHLKSLGSHCGLPLSRSTTPRRAS